MTAGFTDKTDILVKRNLERGVRQVKSLLRRAPEDIKDGVGGVIKDFAQAVHAQALKRTPRDSGTLARSLTYRVSKSGLSARVGLVTKRAQQDAFYLRFLERGFVPASGSRKRRRGGARARENVRAFGIKAGRLIRRPILRPAIEAELPYFEPDIEAAIDKAIDGLRGR